MTATVERRWPSPIRTLESRPMPDASDTDTMSADDLVTSHLALVGYLVNEVASRLPSHVAREDLHSAGLVGLVQAAAAFDPTRGVPFRRYATTRIRGAMVDELRASDWVSRSVRALGKRKDDAVAQLSVVLGRIPTQAEVAELLGCTVADLDHVDEDLHRTVVLSLDASPDPDAMTAGTPDPDATPEEAVLHTEELGYLHAAVDALPDRLRTVVTMYFLHGKPMADIANVLGVSESRISQMRGEALALMRDGINANLDPDCVTPAARPGGCVDRRRSAYFSAIAEAATYSAHQQVASVPAQRTPDAAQVASRAAVAAAAVKAPAVATAPLARPRRSRISGAA